MAAESACWRTARCAIGLAERLRIRRFRVPLRPDGSAVSLKEGGVYRVVGLDDLSAIYDRDGPVVDEQGDRMFSRRSEGARLGEHLAKETPWTCSRLPTS